MSYLKLDDLDVKNKTVLIRLDLNVPVQDNKITSYVRIDASLPTVKLALEKGAGVLLMSHLGRPEEGKFEEKYSLDIVAKALSEKLGASVSLEKTLDGVEVQAGQVKLLENVRFNKGEKENDESLAKRYAALCDVFVMDAFGTSHRAQASTHGVAKFAHTACAGPLLHSELAALEKALSNPERPFVALVGGSKVSSKLTVLDALSKKVDQLVVGGGISNTFVLSEGNEVGNSLVEPDLVDEAKRLRAESDVVFASDVRTTTAGFSDWADDAPTQIKATSAIEAGEEIIDYGPETAKRVGEIMKNAKTIMWNGPCGVFEFEAFANGTKAVAQAIADSQAFSIAGGGDTLAAIDKFGLAEKISYISTGGGAFLEYVEGKELPAVAILKERANAS